MDEPTREWLRCTFGDPPARDVVPGGGLTVEALRRMNDAAGTVVELTIPGEVVTDVDGLPIAVAPPRVERAELGGAVITQAEADRLGIDPADFQNIHITPDRSMDA